VTRWTFQQAIMKASTSKPGKPSPTPVFPQTPHRRRPNPPAGTPRPKAPERDNIFSKSRDTREDRGMREMKTSHHPQTIPHAR